MTKQEIFDKVAAHLLTQKKQSIVSGSCVYRGAGGLKCAAGVLIPDSLYHHGMEGRSALTVFTTTRGLDYSVELARLVDALQKIHDYGVIEHWKDMLESIAQRQNLSSDILKNF